MYPLLFSMIISAHINVVFVERATSTSSNRLFIHDDYPFSYYYYYYSLLVRVTDLHNDILIL